MKTEQYILTDGLLQTNLVLLFGATNRIKEKGLTDMIRSAYPNACIFGCTTAGEIIGTQVLDNSLGEISPFAKGGTCELHNQTMTITALSEE